MHSDAFASILENCPEAEVASPELLLLAAVGIKPRTSSTIRHYHRIIEK